MPRVRPGTLTGEARVRWIAARISLQTGAANLLSDHTVTDLRKLLIERANQLAGRIGRSEDIIGCVRPPALMVPTT